MFRIHKPLYRGLEHWWYSEVVQLWNLPRFHYVSFCRVPSYLLPGGPDKFGEPLPSGAVNPAGEYLPPSTHRHFLDLPPSARSSFLEPARFAVKQLRHRSV